VSTLAFQSVLLFYIKVDIKEHNSIQLILQILKSGKILAKITYAKLYQTFVMSVLIYSNEIWIWRKV